MKAAVHTRYGPPDVVRIIDVDTPVPEANEILVKVYVTTVNRTDSATRAGKPFLARIVTGIVRPKATVLGNEFAGEVEAIGSAVTSFGVGDRVFGYNEGPFGAHAEYLTVREDGSVVTMAADSTFEEVAASTEGSHYALGFIKKAKIESGQDVLVNGATGAIGSAAVQLVKALGANVTAVCGTEHVAQVRELGADRVIDYQVDDFTEDDQAHDVVLDAVGKSTFGRCRRLLKPRGIYMSSEAGPLAQNLALALVSPLRRGRKVMFAIPTHEREMMTYFKELLTSGELTPLIDRRYSLDQIVEAYRYVETGQKIGNVLITVKRSDAV
jgi:NADPH:quinone reductase-like Zn-dependent oxidoreductase